MNLHRLALLLAAVNLAAGCSGGAPAGVVVREVVDGDTLEVVIDGRRERVRLLGIDTPETKHPTKPVQCFGNEAHLYLASLLPPGTAVHVVRDVEARDRFGRLLLHLFIDGDESSGSMLHVNAELVRRGFARLLSIAPNDAFDDALARALVEARSARRGLWGACTQ
jgi:micrococcal nuclease